MCGVYLLDQVAQVTTRFNTTSPRAGFKAIKVVVNYYSCYRAMEQKEELEHLRFCHYLDRVTNGIELSGILVTPSVVTNIFLGFAVHLPLLVALMQGLWHSYSGESDRPHASHGKITM